LLSHARRPLVSDLKLFAGSRVERWREWFLANARIFSDLLPEPGDR
jgi:hypothetical protein